MGTINHCHQHHCLCHSVHGAISCKHTVTSQGLCHPLRKSGNTHSTDKVITIFFITVCLPLTARFRCWYFRWRGEVDGSLPVAGSLGALWATLVFICRQGNSFGCTLFLFCSISTFPLLSSQPVLLALLLILSCVSDAVDWGSHEVCFCCEWLTSVCNQIIKGSTSEIS